MSRNAPSGERARFEQAVHERWPEITDDQLHEMEGSPDVLVGKVQAAYGLDREQALREVKAFLDDYDLARGERV